MAPADSRPVIPRRPAVSRMVRAITSPYYRYRHAKVLHSLRVGLAMLFSILATTGIDIPHGIWSSVTLLVVIGGLQHHGNIRKKAAERAAGTLLGASIGLALIVQQNLIGSLPLTYVLMAIVAAICAWFAIGSSGYIGLLTAITMCIVAGHGDNVIDVGLWRTLNVLIGIVIALAFSFALPLHATYSWRYGLAANLRECARIYTRLLEGESIGEEEQVRRFLEINRRLVQLRSLMPSVAKEIDVPQAKLEEIQRLHRSVLSSLELLATGPLMQADAAARAAYTRRCGAEVQAVRTMLLATARGLRFGRTQRFGGVAKGAAADVAAQNASAACLPATVGSTADASPAGAPAADALTTAAPVAGSHAATPLTPATCDSALPLPPDLQGPYWLGQRLAEQVARLRAALCDTESRWNIERHSRILPKT
ncbi:FUSC family protein [Paraburkholderia phenoliruptrix]|uniref:FUSC family protein n=1 Tax=Paraburkholderia phenoliruptrix TaxID=252970 RepID=UPI001C4E9B7E|nr:FUSC family protein [Paraburkholderia phenoliruptrix]MBW0446722.1 FUSC family protein [Paraburkholderia phenoliruptrix]MBW9099218.1 FUSC family protein [Paraburkholderia phenoliruptrix]